VLELQGEVAVASRDAVGHHDGVGRHPHADGLRGGTLGPGPRVGRGARTGSGVPSPRGTGGRGSGAAAEGGFAGWVLWPPQNAPDASRGRDPESRRARGRQLEGRALTGVLARASSCCPAGAGAEIRRFRQRASTLVGGRRSRRVKVPRGWDSSRCAGPTSRGGHRHARVGPTWAPGRGKEGAGDPVPRRITPVWPVRRCAQRSLSCSTASSSRLGGARDTRGGKDAAAHPCPLRGLARGGGSIRLPIRPRGVHGHPNVLPSGGSGRCVAQIRPGRRAGSARVGDSPNPALTRDFCPLERHQRGNPPINPDLRPDITHVPSWRYKVGPSPPAI